MVPGANWVAFQLPAHHRDTVAAELNAEARGRLVSIDLVVDSHLVAGY